MEKKKDFWLFLADVIDICLNIYTHIKPGSSKHDNKAIGIVCINQTSSNNKIDIDVRVKLLWTLLFFNYFEHPVIFIFFLYRIKEF